MIELEHSPLGGSSAYRFLNCEFSFLEHRRELQAGTHENITSEFAERGTGAHELGALCLIDGTEPYEHIGETYNGFKAGWEGADGFKLDAVSVYVSHCRQILQDQFYHSGGKNYDRRWNELFIEKTFHLPDIHPLLKGTVDFGLITDDGLWLRDYKNGEGVGVGPVHNEQLLYYSFCMIMGTPGLRDMDPEFPVNVGIVQPNFYGIFEDPETWTTTLGYVVDWGFGTLLHGMTELMVNQGTGKATAGDWCQFCPVMLSCPKLSAAFVAFAEGDEDFITMKSNQELSDLYALRTQANRFGKVLEQTVYARKASGQDIPSAKLVEKKVARVWKPGAQAALIETFGDKAYKAREPLSPAGIEKLSTRGKELAKEWGYKPETGSLTVAPLSDPRAEAQPRTNATVFSGYAKPIEDMEGW